MRYQMNRTWLWKRRLKVRKKALAYITNHTVDVLTLDVEMPGMDGLRACRAQKLNKDRPRRSVRASSWSAPIRCKGADITIKALQSGAFDFINKPNGPDSKANQDTLNSSCW